MARELAKLNVGVVFVGYPRNIAREHPGKGNVSVWSYRKLKMRVAATLENWGIAVFEVPEDGTSKICLRHGCEVQEAARFGEVPAQPRDAQRRERCFEHPEAGRSAARLRGRGAGARESAQLHTQRSEAAKP